MSFKSTMESQTTFHLCFLGKAFPWIAILALMLIFVPFKGLEVSCILVTSTLMIVSSLLFTLLKKPSNPVEKQEASKSVDQESSSIREYVSFQPKPESEIFPDKNETSENQVWENHVHDFSFRSSDSLLSESEGLAKTSISEDSELGWSFEGSDSSISDDDNFIEITLPSGQWQNVDYHHKNECKFNQKQHKCLDMFQGVSNLKQQFTLMDLLAEINDMNEEENFIEIDILMGSIKYPRFEIEA